MSDPFSLAGIVRTHAARRGGSPMLTFGAGTITWAEMAARAASTDGRGG